ncbi:MAG: hypothetical protein U0324_19630 [Polyangiales bacterium]
MTRGRPFRLALRDPRLLPGSRARSLALAAWLAASGCEVPRTQIIVRIEATADTWARVRSVHVLAQREAAGARPIVSRCFDVDVDPRFERSREVGLVPRDAEVAQPVRVVVSLFDRPCAADAGAPEGPARLAQEAEVSFEPERTTLLVMPFTLPCADAACPSGQTCQGDAHSFACVPIRRAALPEYAPATAAPAAAAPADVAPADVATDAWEDLPPDAATDVTPDAPRDAAIDVAMEAAMDAATEVAMEAAADVATDAPSPRCDAGMFVCEGRCVDPMRDLAHCGGCDLPCPAGALACVGGACLVVEEIAAGQGSTCARLSDGSLRCWGANDLVVLGGASGAGAYVPRPVGGVSGVRSVAEGGRHACVVQADTTVRCWGANLAGEAGQFAADGGAGSGSYVTTPTAVAGLVGAVQVVAGESHTCVRMLDGSVRCWGNASAIGAPSEPLAAPFTPGGLPAVTALVAGARHNCALSTDGMARCWGNSNTGAVSGTSTNETRPTPLLAPVGGPEALYGGSSGGETCARSGGALRCWGGYDASWGEGTARVGPGVRTMGGVADVRGACSYAQGGCAISGDGSVRCWGVTSAVWLGAGATYLGARHYHYASPVRIPGVSNATQIACRNAGACALTADRSVWCWGEDPYLGGGPERTAEPVPGLADVASLCTGWAHACAATAAGSVYCWGANDDGQLGDGTTTPRLSPTQVPALGDVRQVTCGAAHTCARLGDGSVRCWGVNDLQEASPTSAAVRILTPTTVVASGAASVRSLNRHTCAVGVDGTVRCWGYNGTAQLGDGTMAARTSVVVVPGVTDARDVAPHDRGTCARLGSGRVSCWGSPAGWAGTATRLLTPTPMDGLPDAADLRCGATTCCARRAAGGFACWGGSTFEGVFAAGAAVTTATASPRIAAASDVAFTGQQSVLLRAADGSVQFLGYDPADVGGVLIPGAEAPVDIPGAGPVAEVVSGPGEFACARRADRTVVCWGDNAFGQRGTGRASTMPVRVRF